MAQEHKKQALNPAFGFEYYGTNGNLSIGQIQESK